MNAIMMGIVWIRMGPKMLGRRLLTGEILPSLFYILWLFVHPKPEALYLLPLFVSFVGKSYLLLCPPNNLDVPAV
jgi:hypothetical protein